MIAEDHILQEDWWNDITEDEFQEMFRMTRKTLIDLQAEIDYSENSYEDRIDNTLLACVWFLGNTKTFEEAAALFNINNIEDSIQEYLLKILRLATIYISWPTASEFQLIESQFIKEYQFPRVIGVVGSLHLEINASNQTDSELYYNEMMEKHSIVLQVVCDSNCLLRDVCVGCPGGKSILQIFTSSPLYKSITSKTSLLSACDYHLLGGTELPLLDNLLTPYRFTTGQNLTEEQYQYNALHGSAMTVVEKTFKCLENRFPRLTTVHKAEFSSLITSCICVLHNFTRVRNDNCELYV